MVGGKQQPEELIRRRGPQQRASRTSLGFDQGNGEERGDGPGDNGLGDAEVGHELGSATGLSQHGQQDTAGDGVPEDVEQPI